MSGGLVDLSSVKRIDDVMAASNALLAGHKKCDAWDAVLDDDAEAMIAAADYRRERHKEQKPVAFNHRRVEVEGHSEADWETMEMSTNSYCADTQYECPETGLLLQDDCTGPTVIGTTRPLARRGQRRKRTLVLWDWDDTLFPTSWVLLERKLRLEDEVSEEDLAALDAVAQAVEATLQHVARWKAEMVIITNAEGGWVQESCARFFPRLLPYLDTFRVVSARDTYGSRKSKNPVVWKARALGAEIARFCKLGINLRSPIRSDPNLIVIGDSTNEQQAIWYITEAIDPNLRRIKSVKLEERPTLECLQRTHEVLLEQLHTCWIHDGDADLAVYVDPDDPSVASLIPYIHNTSQVEAIAGH